MASSANVQVQRFVQGGPDVVLRGGYFRQGCRHIQPGDSLGRLQQPPGMAADLLADFAKQPALNLQDAVLRIQDKRLIFLQLRRDITLRVGQRLLADVHIRHTVAVGPAHFQVVAEYFVEAHLQRRDAGALPLPRLKGRHPFPGMRGRIDHPVQLC